MAEVIRLVCPECDAVHRVKSVTLGKLYRCKKCRSGLITMQPAILSCPNCGATTPPTHIEASRLITCEECEKAPLMEVRLPGVEYPNTINSDQGEDIASKMFVPNPESDSSRGIEVSHAIHEDDIEDSEQNLDMEVDRSISENYENSNSPDELDENIIFKADTNFIVKGRVNSDRGDTSHASDVTNRSSLQQLEIFEQKESEELIESESSAEQHESSSTFDISEDEHEEEIMPDIRVDEVVQHIDEIESEEVYSPIQEYSQDEYEKAEERVSVASNTVIPQKRKGWSWRLPAWIPAILTLLLIGLYGMLYADLDSMRVQFKNAQESMLTQDKDFQEERNKYISLIRSTQEENRKLRSQLLDLKSENEILRKKSIPFDIPELKED